MSYTKHTWETGEIITADKLNNIENSISKISENTIMVINISTQTGRFDKTWQEIFNHINNNGIAFTKTSYDNGAIIINDIVTSITNINGNYSLQTNNIELPISVLNPDDYPAVSNSEE